MSLEHEKNPLMNILHWVNFVKERKYWPAYLGSSKLFNSDPYIVPIISLLDEKTIMEATNKNKEYFLDNPSPLTKELMKRGYLK